MGQNTTTRKSLVFLGSILGTHFSPIARWGPRGFFWSISLVLYDRFVWVKMKTKRLQGSGPYLRVKINSHGSGGEGGGIRLESVAGRGDEAIGTARFFSPYLWYY